MNNLDIIDRYYRAHREELVAYASARLHYSPEAEDLVQEVFLRLPCSNRPICEENLDNLVYTMCRNLIIDWYRHHTVKEDYEHDLIRSSRGTASAESVLSIREITEQLERGLARLPKDCQEIYRLHIYNGMQASDICKYTGEKYKAVEYRLGLARKQIRNYLRQIS